MSFVLLVVEIKWHNTFNAICQGIAYLVTSFEMSRTPFGLVIGTQSFSRMFAAAKDHILLETSESLSEDWGQTTDLWSLYSPSGAINYLALRLNARKHSDDTAEPLVHNFRKMVEFVHLSLRLASSIPVPCHLMSRPTSASDIEMETVDTTEIIRRYLPVSLIISEPPVGAICQVEIGLILKSASVATGHVNAVNEQPHQHTPTRLSTDMPAPQHHSSAIHSSRVSSATNRQPIIDFTHTAARIQTSAPLSPAPAIGPITLPTSSGDQMPPPPPINATMDKGRDHIRQAHIVVGGARSKLRDAIRSRYPDLWKKSGTQQGESGHKAGAGGGEDGGGRGGKDGSASGDDDNGGDGTEGNADSNKGVGQDDGANEGQGGGGGGDGGSFNRQHGHGAQDGDNSLSIEQVDAKRGLDVSASGPDSRRNDYPRPRRECSVVSCRCAG